MTAPLISQLPDCAKKAAKADARDKVAADAKAEKVGVKADAKADKTTVNATAKSDKVKIDAKADKTNAATATTAVKAEGKADVKAATGK